MVGRLTALLAVLAIALAIPATASGQGTLPPGNGATNEYTEDLPGPGGNTPAEGSGSGGGNGGGGSGSGSGSGAGGGGQSSGPAGSAGGGTVAGGPVLSAEERRELEALGPDGVAAAALAERTAPNGAGGKGASGFASGSGAVPGGADVADEEGGSAIGELISNVATGSGDGMGAALPVSLALGLIGALGFLLLRPRRTEPR